MDRDGRDISFREIFIAFRRLSPGLRAIFATTHPLLSPDDSFPVSLEKEKKKMGEIIG